MKTKNEISQLKSIELSLQQEIDDLSEQNFSLVAKQSDLESQLVKLTNLNETLAKDLSDLRDQNSKMNELHVKVKLNSRIKTI